MVVKFWARKPVALIEKEIPAQSRVVDPFCGSGTSGIVSVLKHSSALLSDLNPVSIFIAYNLLSKSELEKEVVFRIVKQCEWIEKEAYGLNGGILNYAIWKSNYSCPECEATILSEQISRQNLRCKRCSRKIRFEALDVKEEPIEVKIRFEREKQTLRSKKFLKDYESSGYSIISGSWYPSSTFCYENGRIFREARIWRTPGIKDLFTPRGLYAASELYSSIEEEWARNSEQGNLLKLAFISSLASATKMLPHTYGSGPSWKMPRFWIPHLRKEVNFIRSFRRRLLILDAYKKEWSPKVKGYNISGSRTDKETTISFIQSDARTLDLPDHWADRVILDPPHYDEVHYFELFYLWQKWLEGKLRDKRFTDYSWWRREIDVNPNAGRDEEYYVNEITRLVKKYLAHIKPSGRLILILHSRDESVLRRTLQPIRRVSLSNLTLSKHLPYIPSSFQGIHGRPKYLYLIRLRA